MRVDFKSFSASLWHFQMDHCTEQSHDGTHREEVGDGELREEAGDISPGKQSYVPSQKLLTLHETCSKILGAMAASLSFASLGAGIGVTSVLIYSLGASKDPYIDLTLELASWIREKCSGK